MLNNYGFSSRFYHRTQQRTIFQLRTDINSYISLLPNDIYNIIYNQVYDIHAFTLNNKITDILDFLKNKKYVLIKAKDIMIIFTPEIDDNNYMYIYPYLEIQSYKSIEIKMENKYKYFNIAIDVYRPNNIRILIATNNFQNDYSFGGDISEIDILEIHNDIQIKNASQAILQEIIINRLK